MFSKDVDQLASTGSVKLRSQGQFTATRKGDIVIIEGSIDNKIEDLYDFNEKDSIFKKYKHLATEGNAKEFLIFGVTSQKLRSTIQLKNGKIKNTNFKWGDDNP